MQFEFPFGSTGEELRDEGINRVLRHNLIWLSKCRKLAIDFINGHEIFTGEDIRICCQKEGLIPRHHNAWGGLINSLIKSKLILNVGTRSKALIRSSHARSLQVYIRNEDPV